MKWDKDAEDEVSRVPFFVRKRVKKRIEEEAASQGSKVVTILHVQACRKRFLGSMEDEVKGFQVENCFGPSGCPNRAVHDGGMVRRIEELLAARDLKAFLRERVKGPLKFHHEFRVSVSDCPNACSRPQIADIGLIGAAPPAVSDSPCTGCGECVAACREKAISIDNFDGPVIDHSKCLPCGKCISACPSGTLVIAQQGWRILVGGRLGRHPRLALELSGIFKTDEALKVIDKCLDLYMTHNVEGERFGEVIDRLGFEAIEKDLVSVIKRRSGRM
ncbi:MAG TPA: 4Fe-4S dicluster domain-containing protein [Dissulfurispiraceae bacterium]|nr:4Fe-4S dicluster domain-containing protein [Dissulfurispiraceae bacterium]